MPLTENEMRLTAAGACLSKVSVITGHQKLSYAIRVYIYDQKLSWFQSEDNEVPAKEANWSGFELEPPVQFLGF